MQNVFRTRLGEARASVAEFEAASPHMRASSANAVRVLTDRVAGFWTVAVEVGAEDLGDYFDMAAERRDDPELEEAMAGYMDLVDGGHREILRVE